MRASLATIEPTRGAPPWAVGIAYPDLGEVGVAMRRRRAGRSIR